MTSRSEVILVVIISTVFRHMPFDFIIGVCDTVLSIQLLQILFRATVILQTLASNRYRLQGGPKKVSHSQFFKKSY